MYWHRPGLPIRPSQLLEIVHDHRQYRMSILHSGIQVRRESDVLPTWVMRQHVHDIYHAVLYLEGESSFLLNGRHEPCKPGTFALVGPGEPHEFYFCSREPSSYIDIGFSLEHEDGNLTVPFHELLHFYAGDRFIPVQFPIQLNERQRVQVNSIIETLTRRLLMGSNSARFSVARCVYDLIEFVIDEVYTVSKPSLPPEEVALVRAKEEIERRFAEHFALREIADVANLSTGYFSRAFKAKFKTTPMAYQRELRIRAAKNLLMSTGHLCKEVASRVGFDDVYLFSKTFSKLVGMPPTAFRESKSCHSKKISVRVPPPGKNDLD